MTDERTPTEQYLDGTGPYHWQANAGTKGIDANVFVHVAPQHVTTDKAREIGRTFLRRADDADKMAVDQCLDSSQSKRSWPTTATSAARWTCCG